jgi:flagellin
MLAIKNNMMAANAARYLGRSYDALASSVERLSSGLRINSAKDDAAGMAVRELMRSDIAVLQQGQRNAQDGVSMLQTMEGAMATIDNALVRMKQLAEQASTGSYSSAQREIMNSEFVEMANEIERIANTTNFNGIGMLNDETAVAIRFGTADDDAIDIQGADMTKANLGIDAGEGSAEFVASLEGMSSATADWVTAAGAEVFAIKFGAEAQIKTDAFVAGGYSMNEIRDLINEKSRAASDYNAAEVVYDEETKQYHLKISAKNDGDVGVDYTDNTFAAGSGLNTADLMDNAGAAGGVVNIREIDDAEDALDAVTDAIEAKDTARARFGYMINRLESTGEVLAIQTENLMTAESRISDVDVATEMAQLTRNQVLAQAGTAMLAQANSIPQMALTLLR